MSNCGSCHKSRENMVAAVVGGKYYPKICRPCLGGTGLSGGGASNDRRRDYEDNAQDTIQPYDAMGQPRVEFFRLYPDTAHKVFTPDEIEQVKRAI